MIKITKQGEIPKDRITIVYMKCENCKTEFVVTEDELQEITVAFGGEYTDCPLCGKHIRRPGITHKVTLERFREIFN